RELGARPAPAGEAQQAGEYQQMCPRFRNGTHKKVTKWVDCDIPSRLIEFNARDRCIGVRSVLSNGDANQKRIRAHNIVVVANRCSGDAEVWIRVEHVGDAEISEVIRNLIPEKNVVVEDGIKWAG